MTFPNRKPDRYVMEWDTTGVTPLPAGWRNIYDDPDNSGRHIVTACPALLIQEYRRIVACWDQGGDLKRFVSWTEHLEPPNEVRVVFAYCDDFGELEAACRVSNYVGPLGPGEPDPSPHPAGSTQNPRNTQNPDSVGSVDSVVAPATTDGSA